MTLLQRMTLSILVLYLLAFFVGSALAARAAGRPVWLFGSARGADRLAAMGFRASFALALFGPVLSALLPTLDPLWRNSPDWLAVPGHLVAVAGAMLAFAAQMAMGASWRVGVRSDAVGDLVTGGLYTLSRNPTFLGQALLLFGVVIALPSFAGLAAAVLFVVSAETQIRSEEAVLRKTHGAAFANFTGRVPRWIGWPRGAGRP
ncbi:methyltransferase family protein [Allosediminivita pacifica]|uniref:methyltransferase family protein n=1 Tax=Allosediminivita pacifica TaxID=1267769 RepID=UPI000D356525|nr:isoprenylcysteine carboxylmethyltransferase family protein [Allosediminivita pacifica]